MKKILSITLLGLFLSFTTHAKAYPPKGNADFSKTTKTFNVSHVSPYMAPLPAGTNPVPFFYEYFENGENGWEFVNGTQANKWIFGNSGIQEFTGKSAYIHPPETTTDVLYNKRHASITHVYKDIFIPAGVPAQEYVLFFDWFVGGNATDYFQVSFTNMTNTPIEGVPFSDDVIFTKYSTLPVSAPIKGNEKIVLTNVTPGETRRLVFSWKNVETGTEAQHVSSALIDNVEIYAIKCITPQSLLATDSSIATIDLTWDATGVTTSNLRYRKVGEVDWVEKIGITSPHTLTDLTEGTEYEIAVQGDCSGKYSFWSTPIKKATVANPAPKLLFSENFESGDNGWTFVNGEALNIPNKWGVSSFNYAGQYINAAYISQDSWNNNYYSDTNTTVHMYKDLDIASLPVAVEYVLSFDWRAGGEFNAGAQDFLRVSLNPKNEIKASNASSPITNMPGSAYTVPECSALQLDTVLKRMVIPINNLLKTKKYQRLVFSWRNNSTRGGGIGIGALIDNIEIYATQCAMPTNIAASATSTDNINLTWSSSAASFTIKYRKVGDENWETTTSSTSSYLLQGLNPGSEYEVMIQANCTQGSSVWTEIKKFTTACLSPEPIPIKQDFNSSVLDELSNGNAPSCWAYYKSASSAAAYACIAKGYLGNGYKLTSKTQGTIGATDIVALISPQFSDDIKTLQVSFKQKQVEVNTLLKVGYLTDPSDISTFKLQKEIRLLDEIGWVNCVVAFDTVTAPIGNKTIVFMHGQVSKSRTILLDDIVIEVMPDCNPVTDFEAISSTESIIALKWVSDASQFNVEYRKIGTTAWSSLGVISGNAYSITGLTAATNYEIRVRSYCSSTKQGNWTPIVVYPTKTIRAIEVGTTAFEDNFDNLTDFKWTILNATQTNKWCVGDKVRTGTTGNAMYISYKGGDDNDYHTEETSVVHFYRDVKFSSSASEYQISFDWKANGKSERNDPKDYINVALADLGVTVEPGNMTSLANYRIGTFNLNTNWKTERIALSSDLYNTTKQLIFSWRNGTGGASPGGAIDNIKITKLSCKSPGNFKAVYAPTSTQQKIKLFWTAEGNNSFVVEYRNLDIPNSEFQEAYVPIGDTVYTLGGLLENTSYEVQVISVCEDYSKSYSPSILVKTSNLYPAEIPFNEEFNGTNKWKAIDGVAANVWKQGNATSSDAGGYSMYITNDNANSNQYSLDKVSVTHIYREIVFPTIEELGNDAAGFALSFDWKAFGERNNSQGLNKDYLRVSIIDIDKKPEPGVEIADYILIKELNMSENWSTASVVIPRAYAGMLKKLVFSWKNDGNEIGNQPPAAIDNIQIIPIACKTPENIRYENIRITEDVDKAKVQLQFTWDKIQDASFVLQHRELGETSWITDYADLDTTCASDMLDTNTIYEYRLGSNCSGDPVYSSSFFIKTEHYPISSEKSIETFEVLEDAAKWTIVNGPTQGIEDIQVNKWYLGEATHAGTTGTKSMYISNDGTGTTNKYTAKKGVVHFYRDVLFSDSYTDFSLLFNWKSAGSTTDYGYVSLVDPSVTPTWGVEIPETDRISNNLHSKTNWEEVVIPLPEALSGKIKRLVFTWRTGGSQANQDPIAIDSIVLFSSNCKIARPIVESATSSSITLSWVASTGASSFVVRYRRLGEGESAWIENEFIKPTGTVSYIIGGLDSKVEYEMQVKNICEGEERIFWSEIIQYKTPCADPQFPLFEDFESTPVGTSASPNAPDCWSFICEQQLPGGNTSAFVNGSIPDGGAASGKKGYHLSNKASSKEIRIALITPSFSRNLNTLRARFKVKFNIGPTTQYFVVGYLRDISTMDSFVPVDTVRHKVLDWEEVAVKFDTVNFTGRTAIVFKHGQDYIHQELYLDDIHIESLALCPDIKNFKVEYVLKDQIKVNYALAPQTEIVCKKQGTTDSLVFTSNNSDNYTISNLLPNTTYEVRMRTMCNTTDRGYWSPTIVVLTKQIPTTTPFREDFENDEKAQQWTAFNGDQINKWCIGSATHLEQGSGKSAYISNAGPESNTYSNAKNSVTHFYRDIDFQSNEKDYYLTFYWKAKGSATAYLRVSMLDADKELKVGYLPNREVKDTIVDSLVRLFTMPANWKGEWIKDTVILPNHYVTNVTTKRLVFSWTNATAPAQQPPVAIDSIYIRSIGCDPISDLRVVPDDTTATVTFSRKENKSKVICREVETSNIVEEVIITTSIYKFTGLKRGGTYEISVQSLCNDEYQSEIVTSEPFTINACGRVTNIVQEQICAAKAIVSWVPMQHQTSWELSYTSQATSQTHTKTVTSSIDTLVGLSARSNYNLSITPKCGTFVGDVSPIKIIETNLCEEIKNIKAVRDGDSVIVSWDSTSFCQESWEIRVVDKMSTVDAVKSISANTHKGFKVKLPASPSGVYKVFVRGVCGTDIYSPQWTFIEATLAVSKTEMNSNIKVAILPNPAKDYTKVTINGVQGDVKMDVITPTGKVVRSETFKCFANDCSKDIILQGLPKGTYLIHLVHKDWIKTEKLVVQ